MNMKRNVFWLGMLAMVLTFGMTAVGCGEDPADDNGGNGGGGTDPLAGTWVAIEEVSKIELKIVAANGSFETLMDGKVSYKGTYTYAGNNVTSTLTHVNPWTFPQGEDQLYTWADLPQKYKDDYNMSQSSQMTVTGNTLSANGVTFTKQGGNSGGGTDPLAGTWVATEIGVKIVAANGSFEFSMDGKVLSKGTYTYAGNNVTATLTHVNPGGFGQGDDQLYTWADLPQKYKDNPDYNLSQTFPMTVTGNTLSWEGVTFTKQGGGSSGGNPAPKVTGAQVYTMSWPTSGTTFITYAGSGSAQDVFLGIDENDDYRPKIGTISNDGKLTFEFPATIDDNRLQLFPNEGGGDGVTKYAACYIVLDNGLVQLFNSDKVSDVNIAVVWFIYVNRDATLGEISVKKGWNFVEQLMQTTNQPVITDFSSNKYKWVIDVEEPHNGSAE